MEVAALGGEGAAAEEEEVLPAAAGVLGAVGRDCGEGGGRGAKAGREAREKRVRRAAGGSTGLLLVLLRRTASFWGATTASRAQHGTEERTTQRTVCEDLLDAGGVGVDEHALEPRVDDDVKAQPLVLRKAADLPGSLLDDGADERGPRGVLELTGLDPAEVEEGLEGLREVLAAHEGLDDVRGDAVGDGVALLEGPERLVHGGEDALDLGEAVADAVERVPQLVAQRRELAVLGLERRGALQGAPDGEGVEVADDDAEGALHGNVQPRAGDAGARAREQLEEEEGVGDGDGGPDGLGEGPETRREPRVREAGNTSSPRQSWWGAKAGGTRREAMRRAGRWGGEGIARRAHQTDEGHHAGLAALPWAGQQRGRGSLFVLCVV